jgi:hypothetical protein
MCDRGLYHRRQDTGELTGSVTMGGIEVARRLAVDRVFAGPLRGNYFVYMLSELRLL